jgi:adenosylcobinamide-phosphate synthase
LALVLGIALDRALADPRRGHPVALFGRAAGALERRVWAPSRLRGAAYTAGCVGSAYAVGALATRAPRPLRLGLAAAATWAVAGGTTLRREASAMSEFLCADDLPAARGRLSHLCGRDPSVLDTGGLARATVESVAENTSDAVVAPLLWGAVAGVPGLLAYRAVNTLDAMVGHRTPRHERFGWASARLDDVANLAPARLTALLAVAAAPLVGGSPRAAWRVARRDGAAHPSPNSGHCEAAFAGALGVRLGGRNVYAGRVEDRPTLGDGPAPAVPDIERAARLSLAVERGALATAVLLAVAARPARRRARATLRREWRR